MVFSEFKQAMVDVMTGEGFEVEVTDIQKSDGTSYTGLRRIGGNVTPVLNLEAFHQMYREEGMDAVIDKAKEIFNQPVPAISASDFTDWARVKDKLIPRLVPNNEVYEDKPGVKVADLKVIFGVVAFSDGKGIGVATVDCGLINMWGKSTDEVYEQAMANLEEEDYDTMDFGLFTVLSNKHHTKGAVECLNPKAAHLLDGKYIIPSSVDEVLIVNGDDFTMDIKDMVEMIRRVNEEAVNEEDRLSENVYRLVDGRLEVVELEGEEE